MVCEILLAVISLPHWDNGYDQRRSKSLQLLGAFLMFKSFVMFFQSKLRHWRFGQVSQRILPLNYFLLAVDDVPKEAVTAHVVGSGEHGHGMVVIVCCNMLVFHNVTLRAKWIAFKESIYGN